MEWAKWKFTGPLSRSTSPPWLRYDRLEGNLMPKAPILRLVPSGKKLSDVAQDVELLAALSGSLMLAVFTKYPDAATLILADLQQSQHMPRLTQGQKQIFAVAFEIVERFAAEAADHRD